MIKINEHIKRGYLLTDFVAEGWSILLYATDRQGERRYKEHVLWFKINSLTYIV